MTLTIDHRPVISTVGIHDISEEAYHADPCPTPSLSRSIAHTLIEQSPRHALVAHPRLNPRWAPKEVGAEADIGAVAHDIIGGRGDKVVYCDFKDWKTKAAQEQRDEALSRGKTPVLLRKKEDIDAMVAAFWQQIGESEHADAYQTANKEKTVVWKEDDIWCRARMDHFDDKWVDDYKTTGGSAEPENWIRNHLFNDGGSLQAVFYPRGLKAVDGKDRTFRFFVQENYEPFALSIITVDPHILKVATEQIEFSINVWSDCLRENKWPAYSKRMVWANMLPWIEKRWEDRMAQLKILADIKKKEAAEIDPARLMVG